MLIDKLLKEDSAKDLLRLATAGSVDDGKSTLIGRLLYESKGIYEDQLEAIEKASEKVGSTGGKLDLRSGDRRLKSRARAGHYDRRRLPLFLYAQAKVHYRGFSWA